MKFNWKHELVSENPFEVEAGNDWGAFDNILKTKTAYFGIASSADEASQRWNLVVAPFENGELGKPRLAFSHDYEVIPLTPKKAYNWDFDAGFQYSPDSSKIVFCNVVARKDGKKNEAFAIAVFDDHMNLIWDKIQELPYPDKDFTADGFFLSDTGDDIVITGKEKVGKKDNDYIYKIFHIGKDHFREQTLDIGKKHLPTTAHVIIGDRKNTVIGFYQNSGGDSGIEGMFWGEISPNGNFDRLEKTPFGSAPMVSATQSDILPETIGNAFKIRTIEYNEDGDMQIFAESFRKIFSRPYTPQLGYGQAERLYGYGDLMVLRLDHRGRLRHTAYIDRGGYSTQSPYSRYLFGKCGSGTFLYLMDYATKAEKKELETIWPIPLRRVYVFSKSGKFDLKKIVFNPFDIMVSFSKINAIVNNDTVVFGGHVKPGGGLRKGYSKKQRYVFISVKLDLE